MSMEKNALAARLKLLREEKGLLQKELAGYLEITPAAYGFYEQGRRQPDPVVLNRLADFFDTSVDYLLGRTEVRKPAGAVSYPQAGNLAADLPREVLEEIELLKNYVIDKYRKKEREQ
jgi:transcriptional regulator with XRE-family HTH domain